MKISALLFIFLAWSSRLPVVAQASSPASSPATAIAPSHRQAAETLLNTLFSEASFNQMIDQRLAAQFKLVPTMQQYEQELRAFMNKYMSWPSLKLDLVEMYAQEFTEAELHDITRFYQSPVGQKAIAKIPVLRQKALDIGLRRVQEHLPEFQETITKKAGKAGQLSTDD